MLKKRLKLVTGINTGLLLTAMMIFLFAAASQAGIDNTWEKVQVMPPASDYNNSWMKPAINKEDNGPIQEFSSDTLPVESEDAAVSQSATSLTKETATAAVNVFFAGQLSREAAVNIVGAYQSGESITKETVTAAVNAFFAGQLSREAAVNIVGAYQSQVLNQLSLEPISIATPTEKLPDDTVVAQITTEVKGSEVTAKESGASGAFGITTLNLATGTITVQDKLNTRVITAQDKQAYLEAIQNMLGVIDRQIAKEPDAANKEKLQTVADFLADTLLKQVGLEQIEISTLASHGQSTVDTTVNNGEIIVGESIVAKTGVGYTWAYNLVNGAIHYKAVGDEGQVMDNIITPDQGTAYLNALDSMLHLVNDQIGLETDAANKEKLQTVADYLTDTLLKQQGYIKLTGTIKVNDAAPSGGSGNLMAGPSIYLETENGTYAVKNPTSYYADPLWQELIPLKDTKVMLYANISPISPYSGYKGYLENLKNIVPIR